MNDCAMGPFFFSNLEILKCEKTDQIRESKEDKHFFREVIEQTNANNRRFVQCFEMQCTLH